MGLPDSFLEMGVRINSMDSMESQTEPEAQNRKEVAEYGPMHMVKYKAVQHKMRKAL